MGKEWFHNLREGGIPRELAKGIRARIFPGTNLMLSAVELEPGSESPVHSHPNEQWGVCLEGEWIRVQDGQEYHVRAGDFWETPPHVPTAAARSASAAWSWTSSRPRGRSTGAPASPCPDRRRSGLRRGPEIHLGGLVD